jgi:hypothetical protein
MLVCIGCDRPSKVKRVRLGGKAITRVCKKCEREF